MCLPHKGVQVDMEDLWSVLQPLCLVSSEFTKLGLLLSVIMNARGHTSHCVSSPLWCHSLAPSYHFFQQKVSLPQAFPSYPSRASQFPHFLLRYLCSNGQARLPLLACTSITFSIFLFWDSGCHTVGVQHLHIIQEILKKAHHGSCCPEPWYRSHPCSRKRSLAD